MTKEKISPHEYLQLVGLLTLARHHATSLEGIQRAARAITGDVEWGLVDDAVWSTETADVDELLRDLKITIEPESESANVG